MEPNPRNDDSPPRASRRPLVWLGALVFFLHLIVTGGHLMSPDEELLYRMTEGIALRGSTAVFPLEADAATGALDPALAPHTFATRPGREPGTFYAQYLPLQPLLAAPLVWLGRLAPAGLAEAFAGAVPMRSMALGSLLTLEQDRLAREIWARGLLVMLFNPLVAALSAVLLARLGRLLTGCRRAGILAAVMWAFGTMAWPHSRTFFTEPLAGLLALVALDQVIRWFLARDAAATRHAVAAGLALALANWTRVDSPFFTVGIVPPMVLLAAWKMLRDNAWGYDSGRRYPWLDIALAGGISLMGWLLLQQFNAARFGAVDATSGYGHQSEGVKFTTPLLVGLHGLLMSPGKGLFFFSPALVLGVWGWLRVPHHLAWLRWTVLAVYTPFFLAMAMWQNWEGGWCWGPRHVVQIHLPIMLGAVFLFAGHINWKRRAAGALMLVVGAGVQLFGSSQDPLAFYREYFVTMHDGIYLRSNLVRGPQVMEFEQQFVLKRRRADGGEGEGLSPEFLPAPLVDSLYIPQHTQWARYGEMWTLGYCDWYFWTAVVRSGETRHWEER